MDNITEKFHKSVNTWSASTKNDAEQNLTKAMFNAGLETIEQTDKFLNWILGITGVTIALSISNFNDLSKLIDISNLKLWLVLLAVSGFFGFIAKILSLQIHIQRIVSQKVLEFMKPVFTEFESMQLEIDKTVGTSFQRSERDREIDFNLVIEQFMEPFGCIHKFFLRRAIEKSKSDPLFMHKRAVKLYRYLSYLMAVEIAVLFGAVTTVVSSI